MTSAAARKKSAPGRSRRIPEEYLLRIDKSLLGHQTGGFRFSDAWDRENRLLPEMVTILRSEELVDTPWKLQANFHELSSTLHQLVNWYWAQHAVAMPHYASDPRIDTLAAEIESLKREAKEAERAKKVLGFAAKISGEIAEVAEEAFGSKASCISQASSSIPDFFAEIRIDFPPGAVVQGEERATRKRAFYEKVLKRFPGPELNQIDFIFTF